MDVEKSFSFPFEDQEWLTKLGLGAILGIIPVLNFAWTGYLVELIRNVMNGDLNPLPTWEHLDKKFGEGLILFTAGFIYTSPIWIALCLPLGIAASSGLFSGNNNLQDIQRTMAETGPVLFVCLLCVFLLYGLTLSLLYPVILVMFAREGTFASCFRLREGIGLIRTNARPFFTAWTLSLLASLGTGLLVGFVNLVVGLVPCIGWVIRVLVSFGAGAYGAAVYAHVFGQFGRTAFKKIPPSPPRTLRHP